MTKTTFRYKEAMRALNGNKPLNAYKAKRVYNTLKQIKHKSKVGQVPKYLEKFVLAYYDKDNKEPTFVKGEKYIFWRCYRKELLNGDNWVVHPIDYYCIEEKED